MAITPEVLKRLAELNELRVEALNTPSSPNELQVFQVRPTALYLSVLGDLIPTDTVLEAAIPVTIKVQWQVEDLRGVPLSQEEAVVYGQDLQATVMVAPDFVELSRSFVPTTKTRYLAATAELSCNLPEPRGGTISVRVPLSRYPITVACVPIPTVALCFHSANLGMVGGSIVEVGDHGLTVVRRLDAVPPSTEPAGEALQSAGPTLDNRISSYAFL